MAMYQLRHLALKCLSGNTEPIHVVCDISPVSFPRTRPQSDVVSPANLMAPIRSISRRTPFVVFQVWEAGLSFCSVKLPTLRCPRSLNSYKECLRLHSRSSPHASMCPSHTMHRHQPSSQFAVSTLHICACIRESETFQPTRAPIHFWLCLGSIQANHLTYPLACLVPRHLDLQVSVMVQIRSGLSGSGMGTGAATFLHVNKPTFEFLHSSLPEEWHDERN
ncbi:hypothetical protein BC827DRAFT_1230253 [Russula dissimulans]|nr:hypothetical protein BC827DRAFT_1230253 [Russula dissimulans]